MSGPVYAYRTNRPGLSCEPDMFEQDTACYSKTIGRRKFCAVGSKFYHEVNEIMALTREQAKEVRTLQIKAAENRQTLIDLTYISGYSHLGGPLSATDILTALYQKFLDFDKDHLDDPERDRFVLSKGHNADIMYCIFANIGLYDRDVLMREYNAYMGRWGERPNRFHNPGFEICSDSLGHGMPIAIGMAMAARIDKSKRRVYCLGGDGELQEGSNWEAIMNAGHNKFGNLIMIVDQNRCQGCRLVSETINSDNLGERIASFGWDVWELADGNDMKQIYEVLNSLPVRSGEERAKPICILLHTKKGCGVQYMEDGMAKWHAGGIGDDKIDETRKSINDKLAAQLAVTDAIING